MLTPILVDYASRDGSTLLMRLLHSSPNIAVEPPYPYEKKYFAYLLRWSRLLDRPDWHAEPWSPAQLGSLTQERRSPLLGPPPWFPRSYFDADPDESISVACFRLAWEEFSRRAARSVAADRGGEASDVTFYAEKHLNTRELDLSTLPTHRVLALLRDPRDVFISIEAFNRGRPDGPWIGTKPGEAHGRWRDRFVEQQRDRLNWIGGLVDADDPDRLVIRYEALVRDLEGEAKRIAKALGVELDAGAVLEDRELRDRHATTDDAAASVGRWERELADEDAVALTDGLGEELDRLGFST